MLETPTWLDNLDALGARIQADRMITFHLAAPSSQED